MQLHLLAHEADDGGYLAEVPSILGCATQGDSLEYLLENMHEAVVGCLSANVQNLPISDVDQIIEMTV